MTESHYRKEYGMNMGKSGPDLTRCCVEVGRDMGRWTQFGQCANRRGFGPDKAYCKTHDPAVVEARKAKVHAQQTAKHNAHRYEWHGRTFYNALKQIAEGHNDSRGLAQSVIDTFHAGESK